MKYIQLNTLFNVLEKENQRSKKQINNFDEDDDPDDLSQDHRPM